MKKKIAIGILVFLCVSVAYVIWTSGGFMAIAIVLGCITIILATVWAILTLLNDL
jgi:hypothetical protein